MVIVRKRKLAIFSVARRGAYWLGTTGKGIGEYERIGER